MREKLFSDDLKSAPSTLRSQSSGWALLQEWRHSAAHLPQLEEHPRVVSACDLVQEVIHYSLAVAPSIFHKLLQAGKGQERTY